jgi:hypothetical protein
MPELKYLRGVRVQEYDEDECLQDGAEHEHQVSKPALALVDRLAERAPRDRKRHRANTGRSAEPLERAE